MNEKMEKDFYNENMSIISIDEIRRNIKSLNITKITLTDKGYVTIQDGSLLTLLKTDYEHPFTMEKDLFNDNCTLYINPDFYKDNNQIVNELMCYIAKNIDEKLFSITHGCLVNDNLIDSLCENKNIELIDLGSDNEIGYTLTYNDYLKFKKSNIERVNSYGIDNDLKDNYDSVIGYNYYKELISYYTYEDLVNEKVEIIYLYKRLNDEEIENFKYIHSNINIELEGDSYLSFYKIYDKLNELKKDFRIILNVKNKIEFNNFILNSKIKNQNIFVKIGTEQLLLEEYLKFEQLLYYMIKPAIDLSPFERFIYAYNITKQLKKYKENPYDKSQSRDLYSVIFNDYMVCVGFSSLFGDLLEKLGIKNKNLSVSVDTSYDKSNSEFKTVPVNKSGHSRRYVYINDKKYGIDGFYVSDPTWDNNLEYDFYNYAVLTDKEAASSNRYIWFDDYGVTDLFNVNSIQEFYNKINFMLNRKNIENELKYIIITLINEIQELDELFVNDLKLKYDFINNLWQWPSDLSEIIYDLGKYIVRHVNKPVFGDIIMKAVEQVYRHSYGYDEDSLNKKLIEVIEKNKERQEKAFPKRYKEYEDGRKEIYDNEINKFDIDIPSKKL